jgi:hypothetical protein
VKRPRWTAFLACFVVAALAACGGGGGGSGSQPPAVAPADISLLFMGNSHTSTNSLPDMVAAMVRAARPNRSVAQVEAPGLLFLGERATDPASLALLRDHAWTFVVLQAQEYSSSGLVDYPIDGAETLVRMATAQNAVPILFPEWPRKGIDESQRIYQLHVSIARATPACVAPIPQAFDLAAVRAPDLVLHASDGNHSSPAGAFLAALVIANTMTAFAPDAIPYLAQFPVDEVTQQRLKLVASETVAANPPRQWCPGMPVLTARSAVTMPRRRAAAT